MSLTIGPALRFGTPSIRAIWHLLSHWLGFAGLSRMTRETRTV